MLKWNSTELREPYLKILNKKRYNALYWKISYKEDPPEWCRVKKSRTTMPAIIDYMKDIFGVQRTGCHYLKRDRVVYILYKVVNMTCDSKYEYMELRIDDIIKERVQRLYTYYEAMGVRLTRGDLYIRKYNEKFLPLIYEKGEYFRADDNFLVPDRVVSKWYNGTSICRVLRDMLGSDNMPYLLNRISNKLERIIMYIDPEHIWFKSSILKKITVMMRSLECDSRIIFTLTTSSGTENDHRVEFQTISDN